MRLAPSSTKATLTEEQSHVYNTTEYIKTDVPEQTLLRALRLGINAIDTSVYYGSEPCLLAPMLR